MKRNWDTIRKNLKTIESLTNHCSTITNSEVAEKNGVEIGECTYHIKLLLDAGLIEGQCSDYQGDVGSACFIQRLTWEGHEFLDQIKSDTVWAKVKQTASQQGLELTLGLVGKLAVKIIDQLI